MRRTVSIGMALWLVGLASSSDSASADQLTCETLGGQFEARQATLEVPQVSAALFASAEGGCTDLAGRLLKAGASVSARDRLGGTALTHAARAGRDAMVRLLLEHGADPDIRTVDGATPLFVAVEQNRLAAAQALLDAGAKLNIPGRAGVTPLSAAAFNGNLQLVDLLLKHGADPTLGDLSGKVPIVYAAARGFTPVVLRLLETGGDIDTAYGNHLTVLMWAAGHANDVPVDDGVQLVGMLLDKGAAIGARDDRGRTALMMAAELDHAEIVDLLLKRGASPDVRDRDGKSAEDLASSTPVRAALAEAGRQSPAR